MRMENEFNQKKRLAAVPCIKSNNFNVYFCFNLVIKGEFLSVHFVYNNTESVIA